MRGFKQIPHVHFQPAWTSAPVTSASTIRIILVMMLMGSGYAHIIDVCSASLLGLFGEHEPKLYANIPKGWEHKIPKGTVLLLLKTVYGLKQAANEFYRLLVASMVELGYVKSPADPCLYYKWDDGLLAHLD